MAAASLNGSVFQDYADVIARALLGEPNDDLSSKDRLRFGSHGSLSVEVGGDNKGRWFDHEESVGGGMLELIRRKQACDVPSALEWARSKGVPLDPPKEKGSFGRIVATYDYFAADGVLLYQVVRLDPKDFRQRKPDGAGGWSWKLGDVVRVPYRLPELLAADPAETVFVVEGEKDVDRLRAMGLVATCNAGGAAKPGQRSKWPAGFREFFAGRDVVILPDNDEPGEAHAASVANNLTDGGTAVRSVRIVRLPSLPPKGDVSDWIADGGDVVSLRRLVDQAPLYTRIAPRPDLPTVESTANAAEPILANLGAYMLNQDSLALAYAEAHGSRLRYCHHACHWYVWTGSIWLRDETGLGFNLARELCRQAAFKLEPGQKKDDMAKASTSASVERMAKVDRALAVTATSWDQNPWLLGTPDGTVDLRTGALQPSRQDDLITKKTAVSPAAAGTAHPLWSAFLDQATGSDKELQAFLQRLVGYCLTGDITEEMLAFLYGDGGTGKGTFIGTIVAVLADYAVAVPIEVFTAGSKINLEYYRAQMAGARLVTASETEGGATWAESQIKEMTGNETPLSARQPYGKAFTYRPTFKIVLVGNHAPRLKGRSKAMERRLRIAPFKLQPKKPDLSLKERLRAEYPAILRWAIEGCLAWQRSRLGTSAAVAAESSAYFEQQDHFGRWMAERCMTGTDVVGKPLKEKPSKLLGSFLLWAKENNEAAVNSGEFREMIERTPGLRYCTIKGLPWVSGIALTPERMDNARYGERDEPEDEFIN